MDAIIIFRVIVIATFNYYYFIPALPTDPPPWLLNHHHHHHDRTVSLSEPQVLWLNDRRCSGSFKHLEEVLVNIFLPTQHSCLFVAGWWLVGLLLLLLCSGLVSSPVRFGAILRSSSCGGRWL